MQIIHRTTQLLITRCITKDSIGGEVPNKYHVVLNSDVVKVRYLLVYNKNSHPAG